MTNYKKENDYDRVFSQASTFMKLVESYNKDEVDFFDLNVIYINMLLASELFLKSILLYYKVNPENMKKDYKHDLLKLYKKLPLDIQKTLQDRMLAFHGVKLDTFLEKVKNDFIDCRYMFVDNKEKDHSLYFRGVEVLMYEFNWIASIIIYGKDTYRELK